MSPWTALFEHDTLNSSCDEDFDFFSKIISFWFSWIVEIYNLLTGKILLLKLTKNSHPRALDLQIHEDMQSRRKLLDIGCANSIFTSISVNFWPILRILFFPESLWKLQFGQILDAQLRTLRTWFRRPWFSKKGYRTIHFLKKFTFLKFLKPKASNFYHPKRLWTYQLKFLTKSLNL